MGLKLEEVNIMNHQENSLDVMDLYLDLHAVQNALSEENLELTKNRTTFKSITKKIKFLVGNGRNNEIF